jgi:predicted phosphodiesterase
VDIAPTAVAELRPIRFAFVSDFQVNADAGAAIVEAINEDSSIEMVLCTGDIIDRGSDLEQWATMEPVLARLRIPLYATTGNHELNGDGGVEYHRRLGRMNYSFDYHGVRFGLADSGSATLAPRVFDFLDSAFAADGAALRIFMTHIPLLDSSGIRNGGFSSRLEAERILAMLARNGVDLTLYGHVHSFEVFSNARIPAFISGGGGGTDNAFDGIGDHFLLVTADPVARRAEAVVREARPQ